MPAPRAFAVAAHPDDIEIMMAGTLLLLREAGWEIHYMNLANGSCGSATLPRDEIVALRRGEAVAACAAMGAVFHESLADDLGIYYEPGLLARLASVMREVAPRIVLTHGPYDYMEDHVNTGRLAVSAAFCRGMRNLPVVPPREPVEGEVAVYHSLPHPLLDTLGRPVRADVFVDISGRLEEKRRLLALHRSQKDWLDRSQGVDSYLVMMEEVCRTMGAEAGCACAEGWVRHLHAGLGRPGFDPLREALGPRVRQPVALAR